MQLSMIPSTQADRCIHVEHYGETNVVASDVNNLSAAFTKSNDRTICFWDLIQDAHPTKMEYPAITYTHPVMQTSSQGCFFTDQTTQGGVLGFINSQTQTLKKIPYNYAHLSVENLNGATIGKIENGCTLMFWDLFTMQEVSTFKMGLQGRNICAMIPSQSNLVVTLQSGTFQTENLISLWDSRSGKKAIKEISEKGDIHSMLVMETSTGPKIVTRSTKSLMIDFRRIFDGVFGQMILTYDSQFGDGVAHSNVPHGSGPYSAYDLSLLSSKNGQLNTATKTQWYTGGCAYELAKQVTFRSYDFKNSQAETVTPNLVIEFPESTTDNPEYTFAKDDEKVVFLGPNRVNGEKSLMIYKV